MTKMKVFIFYYIPWILILLMLPVTLLIAILSWLVFKILGIDLNID